MKIKVEFPTFVRRFRVSVLFRTSCFALAAVLVCASPTVHAAQGQMIITWGGNAPGWNQKLHVNAVRMGCSSAPNGCVQAAQDIAHQQHVNRVFMAILLTPSSVNYAQQYSALSAVNPVLYSVGFDDFVSQIERLHGSPANAADLLDQFVGGLKSANPGLHFGVTIYEDELSSPVLTSSTMANVRSRTDFVHLFIHYRQDGPNFPMYVRQAKELFPNAQIIAGSYPMDRIDYLPCSKNGRACASDQEISLFEKTLDVQLQTLQNGSTAGIEFYPGHFGNISKAGLWKEPRSCRPDRRPECIANSTKMEDYAAKELSQTTF